MKIKPFKSKDLTGGLVSVAGASIGAMLPNGIANAAANVENESTITEDQKKKKMYANVVMMLAGVYGAVVISDDDTVGQGLKALSLGIAAGATKGLAAHFAKDTVATTDPTTITGKLMRGALGCACTPSYSMPSLNRPSLRFTQPQIMTAPMSSNNNDFSNFRLQ